MKRNIKDTGIKYPIELLQIFRLLGTARIMRKVLERKNIIES